MKNLFTHEVSDDRDERYIPYENPYLVDRISPELENKMRYRPWNEPVREAHPEEAAMKAKEKRYGLLALLSFIFAFAAAGVLSLLKLLEYPVMILIPLAGLVASIVFIYMIKRSTQKRQSFDVPTEKIDFHEVARRIAEANDEAIQALKIPEDAAVIEILPYGYKKKGGRDIPANKAEQFDNSPMTCYIRDGKLGLFDGIALYEVPCAHLIGYRTYAKDYRIDFWLKDEEPTAEKYAAFRLRKVGLLEYKTFTYYGVDVYDEETGNAFEMLVAGYDFDTFLGLVPLSQVSHDRPDTR